MAASVYLCSEADRVTSPTPLFPGVVVLAACMEHTGQEAQVRLVSGKCFECSRVRSLVTRLFPWIIAPPVIPVSLLQYLFE